MASGFQKMFYNVYIILELFKMLTDHNPSKPALTPFNALSYTVEMSITVYRLCVPRPATRCDETFE